MSFSLNQTRSFSLAPLLILAWLSHFLVDTMLGIWPVYKSLIQLDLAKAGLIVAIGAFIGEGCQLLFGAFSDRGYRKHLVIVGLLLASASAFFAYFNQYGLLFSLYLMTCLGSGSFHPAAAGLISGLIPNRRGLLMTFFASGGSLGMAASQIIFMQAYTSLGGNIYVLALPIFLLALILILYRFPSQAPAKSAYCFKDILKDFASFFRQPVLRSLYIAQVANQSILWGTIFILPDVLKTLGHTEWICYGGGHLCFILGGFCMMVPAGYLADKYSARQVILAAGIGGIFAFYFILFSGGLSMWAVLPALFMLGASLTLVNPIGVALGIRFEPTKPGSISAFLMGLVWCISEALGPGGVGVMSRFFDDYAPVKALALLGLLYLVQVYATICLPKEELAKAEA